MPSKVYEETVELEIGLLEAEAPDPARPERFEDSYPFPPLSITQRSERRAFRQVVLENDFLIVRCLPELGGRIVGIRDKPSGAEPLEWPGMGLLGDGFRGVELAAGIQLQLQGGRARKNSLGPVDFQLIEEDDCGVWFAEIDQGTDLLAHWKITLPSDRAELELEVRAFNRTLGAIYYRPELLAHLTGKPIVYPERGVVTFDSIRQRGLGLWQLDEPFDSAAGDLEAISYSRFARGVDKSLGPRQLDVWRVSLQPLFGLNGLTAASSGLAISVSETLQIRSTSKRPRAKVVLLGSNGRTLEAPVDLECAQVLELELPETPTAVAILNSDGHELLRWQRDEEVLLKWSAIVPDVRQPDVLSEGLSELALKRASFEPALRAQAHVHLGMARLREQDWQRAESEFESALLYNAEDHLAWWAKAVAARHLADDAEERPEILNAHFLAPLDPLLRAEAFLSQPHTHDHAASPLVAPLAASPEHFIQVTCDLLEHGLTQDAVRWIDEALRHVDLAMLRLLLAWCHLRSTKMTVEAAAEIKLASGKPVAPPYPWRPIEKQALQELAKAFPDEARIKELLALTRLLVQAPARKS